MQLTPREKQVLAEWLRGKLNKQIATDLSVSPDTVKDHLKRIYRKMGVRHGRQAWAHVMGNVARKYIIDPDDHVGFLDDSIV